MKILSKSILLIASFCLINVGLAIPLAAQQKITFTVKGDKFEGYVYNQTSYSLFTNTLNFPHEVKPLDKTGGVAPTFKVPLLPNIDHSQQSFQMIYGATTTKGISICNFTFSNNEGKPTTWNVSAFRAAGDVKCGVGKKSGIIYLSIG